MNIPLISVIIPVYNVELYVAECLDTVINQSYQNLQIIVVDDGSTDNSGQICDEYARKDSRIEVIRQANQGLSAARNTGIEHARGEWLMFVDSDDYVEKEFCESALNMVTENDCQIAVFAYMMIKPGYPDKLFRSSAEYLGKLTNRQAMMALAIEQIGDYAWNKIYHRSLFEDVRYPVGEIYEDIAVTYRVFAQAEHVYLSDQCLYNYRIRKGSIQDRPFIRNIVPKLAQRDKEYAFLQKNYPECAFGTERSMLEDELDACIYCYNNPEFRAEYEQMKKRLLGHTQVYRKFGLKKWVFITALKMSDMLFALVSVKRRKRFFARLSG